MRLEEKKSKRQVKTGQIGIGHNHGSAKMATLRKYPEEVEVAGVAEPAPEWRRRRGELSAYRGLKWMSVEQMLNTPGLQAVTVETDVRDLLPMAKRCIDSGLHIHLDKPAGPDVQGDDSLSDFESLLDNARSRGLIVQMGYMLRNNPAVEFALDAVKKGWLGRIFEIDCVFSRMAAEDYRRWLAQFSGGAMYIFGCHMIDLVIAMMGEPDKIIPFQCRTRPEKDNLYDNGLAVFEYPHATAVIRAAVVELDGMERRQMVICGDEGTIEICPLEPLNPGKATREEPVPMPELKLRLSRVRGRFHAGLQKVELPPMSGRYDTQLIEFARAIRGETEPSFSPAHELTLQKAVIRSSGHGRLI